MTIQNFNVSNLTPQEYIRLNDVTDPFVLELVDMVEQQEKEIEQLKEIIHSFDFETMQLFIENINLGKFPLEDNINDIQTLINNYKLRTRDI